MAKISDNISLIIVSVVFFGPALAWSQSRGATIDSVLETALGIVDTLITIAFGLAIVGFFYGAARYIFGGAQDKEMAKGVMIWGVLAIVVMLSLFGLVEFIQNTIGVGQQSAPLSAPQIP